MSVPSVVRPRVLVVGDSHVREELSAAHGIEVVGEAPDGPAAVERAGVLRPDVVVISLELPAPAAVDAVREIVLRRPGIAVLVLSELDEDDLVFAAMRAGARGHLPRGTDRDEVATAVATVVRGGIILGPAIAERVLAWFASGGDRPLAPFPELTDREREILDLVARGLSDAVIAQRLFLPEPTMRHHVSNVFMKLQVADRSAAVARAKDAARDRAAD